MCNACGLAFATKGNLKQHKLKHEPIQHKFSCEICTKSFNRASNLKEHLVTHTKIKNFQCQACLKKLSSSSALAKHRKIHISFKQSCAQSEHPKKNIKVAHFSLTTKISANKPAAGIIIMSNELLMPPNDLPP